MILAFKLRRRFWPFLWDVVQKPLHVDAGFIQSLIAATEGHSRMSVPGA
jgi:hypothetical protein